jgi:hypothetical protein
MKIASSLIEFDSVSSSTSRTLMETKFVSNKNHRILADSAVTLDVEVIMADFPQYTHASEVYANLTFGIGADVSNGVFDTYLQSYAIEYDAANMGNSYATSVTSSGYSVSTNNKRNNGDSIPSYVIIASIVAMVVFVFCGLLACFYYALVRKAPSSDDESTHREINSDKEMVSAESSEYSGVVCNQNNS